MGHVLVKGKWLFKITERDEAQEKLFWPGGSAQTIENAHFREENPRKSKPFSWTDLAG